MRIIRTREAAVSENPHGVDARRIYDTGSAQAVHITLQPGEGLRKHITPVDVFFYVLEGSGTVEIGDEIETVSQDTLVESPARVPHRLYNESNVPFRFLVVKAPRPTESTRLL